MSGSAPVVGLCVLLLLLMCAGGTCAHEEWPGTGSRDFGGNLPQGFSASGVLYHPRMQQLMVVSDNGQLAFMDIISGLATDVWDLRPELGAEFSDLECITVADPNTTFIYVCNEYPYKIFELDLAQRNVTRRFDLSLVLPPPKKTSRGIEAIAFIPNPQDEMEGGLFLVGSQSYGVIYQVEIPVRSSRTSTAVRLLGAFDPRPQTHDLSGLWYSPWTQRLYILYDTASLLLSTSPDGSTVFDTWDLPKSTSNQEGVAVIGCGPESVIYMAQDNGSKFPKMSAWRYSIPTQQCVGSEAEFPLPDAAREQGGVGWRLRGE